MHSTAFYRFVTFIRYWTVRVTGNFRSLCIVYASLFGSQVFVNIVFETVFTIYEYAKEEEAYNKFFLIVRCIIIVIFFELPTLCFQALAMKKFANLKLSDTIENHNWYTTTEGPDPYFMRWSELGWDFSMQLQFMFQFILFSMIDLNFYFGTFKKKSGLLLLALCAYFTPVYLIQVGGVKFNPAKNDYGGVVDAGDYGTIGLMYVSIGVGIAGCVFWAGVLWAFGASMIVYCIYLWCCKGK